MSDSKKTVDTDGFKYPIGEREIRVSEEACAAGEKAFERPADLRDRTEATFCPVIERLRFLKITLLREDGAVERQGCPKIVQDAIDEIERLRAEISDRAAYCIANHFSEAFFYSFSPEDSK